MSFQWDFSLAWQKYQLITRDVHPDEADREDTARRWYTKGRVSSDVQFGKACELIRVLCNLADKTMEPKIYEIADKFLRENGYPSNMGINTKPSGSPR